MVVGRECLILICIVCAATEMPVPQWKAVHTTARIYLCCFSCVTVMPSSVGNLQFLGVNKSRRDARVWT